MLHMQFMLFVVAMVTAVSTLLCVALLIWEQDTQSRATTLTHRSHILLYKVSVYHLMHDQVFILIVGLYAHPCMYPYCKLACCLIHTPDTHVTYYTTI